MGSQAQHKPVRRSELGVVLYQGEHYDSRVRSTVTGDGILPHLEQCIVKELGQGCAIVPTNLYAAHPHQGFERNRLFQSTLHILVWAR